ncbi:MAG TPA: 4-alpha-glucanotransferase, partial [Terriglobia bacterium]
KWVAQLGGRAVATLPFLAAFLEEPIEISPYMPASRLYWNEFYVDPRKAPEFQDCAAAQSLANSSQWQQEIEALQHSPLVDFPRLMALKRPVIEAMAQWFAASRSGRHAAFEDYVRSHPLLSDYAAFRAVLRRRQAPWPAWPQPLRDGAVGENDYAAEERSYHLYAQWLAEEQIASFANLGNGSNLYLDFPLGVHPHSYDVWRERDIFALGASAGAPPDTLFTKGQYWSFPPLHPETIRDQGYSYLIACLRHQLRHASWFRVDHVMGLHRLFWIPQGLEPKEGVYVQYRPEEMYAILSLESHRSKTVVVGENLGTVPAAVNRAMERHGLHQMYVLQYAAMPSPKRPLRPVPKNAVASLNTHDMPPFGGFFAGGDIEDMQKLGAFDEREAREQSSRPEASPIAGGLLSSQRKEADRCAFRQAGAKMPGMAGAQPGEDGADQPGGPVAGDRPAECARDQYGAAQLETQGPLRAGRVHTDGRDLEGAAKGAPPSPFLCAGR